MDKETKREKKNGPGVMSEVFMSPGVEMGGTKVQIENIVAVAANEWGMNPRVLKYYCICLFVSVLGSVRDMFSTGVLSPPIIDKQTGRRVSCCRLHP